MSSNNAPYLYWVGMNTPGASEAELEKFNDFYNNVHIPEVVGFYGFLSGTRYELFQPDPYGGAPRWLVNYQIGSEEALQNYLARSEGPPEGRPKYTEGPEAFRNNTTPANTPWRMILRRITPNEGVIDNDAEYLSFTSLNLPADATEADHQRFNDFYNNYHVPEVANVMRYTGSSRYEMFKIFRHPEPAPRYVRVHEGGEESLHIHKDRAANPSAYPKLTAGPPIWDLRQRIWDATYRRI